MLAMGMAAVVTSTARVFVRGASDAGARVAGIFQVPISVLIENSVDPRRPKRAVDAQCLIGMGSSTSI